MGAMAAESSTYKKVSYPGVMETKSASTLKLRSEDWLVAKGNLLGRY